MRTLSMPEKSKGLAYIELTKPRITWMILVSTALGFFLGSKFNFDFNRFFWTLIGSGLVSSGSGALNHFAEEDSDRLMERTRSRPIQTGIISSDHVMYFGTVLILLGTAILYFFVNPIVTVLALMTSLLYLFIYTPLKKITWLNTTIGAIPGALPPVGGWVAGSGRLDPESWILFFILFFWQHPHFFAIALMYRDDYKKANLQMLPSIEETSSRTNRQIVWHLFLLIPVSLIPFYIGLLGKIYLVGAAILGLIYLASGLLMIKSYSLKSAKTLLRVSVVYLPVLFLIIIFDILSLR
tara:strand:- start:402 stop:1289 length:888 start_codon:yes stop_codon:yes gene_type:complete